MTWGPKLALYAHCLQLKFPSKRVQVIKRSRLARPRFTVDHDNLVRHISPKSRSRQYTHGWHVIPR